MRTILLGTATVVSSGPFASNPSNPDGPTRCNSLGDWRRLGFDVPAICRGLVGS